MSRDAAVALFLALIYSLAAGVSLVVWSTAGGPFPGFVFIVMFLQYMELQDASAQQRQCQRPACSDP